MVADHAEAHLLGVGGLIMAVGKCLTIMGIAVQTVGVMLVFFDAARIEKRLGLQPWLSSVMASVSRPALWLRHLPRRLWTAGQRWVKSHFRPTGWAPTAADSLAVSRDFAELTVKKAPRTQAQMLADLERELDEQRRRLREHEEAQADKVRRQDAEVERLHGLITEVVGGSRGAQVGGAILIIFGLALTLVGALLSG